MAEQPVEFDSYRVGIICTRAVELDAVVAMLDGTGPSFETTVAMDDNFYTLGRIGAHNVVIARLQPLRMSATVTLQDTMRSFPIKIVLMVGVGGGVWSKTVDLRLGDVVISQPEGIHGGILQFRPTQAEKGTLNTPPWDLINALHHIKANDRIRSSALSTRVASAAAAEPFLVDYYRYPGSENDRLFEADYYHVNGATCDDCDTGKLVERVSTRKDHSPRIFWGRIAFTDKVVRSVERDRLAREEGVICFGIEAARPLRNLPCVAIRGICDYADSHKDKRWQPYAAATAAACAKELLNNIPKQMLDELKLAEYISNDDASGTNDEGVHHLRLIDPRDDYLDLRARLLKDSCSWVHEDAAFQRWWSGNETRILWLHGDPGKGKTMIMTALIDEISQRMYTSARVGRLSYFFCQRGHSERSTATSILRGLICNLVIHQPNIQQQLRKISHFDEASALLPLWDVLMLTTSDLVPGTTYLMIDALDECTSGRDQLLKLITSSGSGYTTRIKWLISRRNESQIEDFLEQGQGQVHISLERNVAHISSAIEKFIHAKVAELQSREMHGPGMQEFVEHAITDQAGDSFLTAELICRELQGKSVSETLDIVTKQPQGLEVLYTRAMAKVNGLTPEHGEVYRRILRAMAVAPRPLKLVDLKSSVTGAVQEADEETAEREFVRELRSHCGMFLTVEEEYVHFVHRSAKEYLGKYFANAREPKGTVSETDSEVSYQNSIFSDVSGYSSAASSQTSLAAIHETAVSLLVQTFLDHTELSKLFEEAVRTISRPKFVRNNSRLLKRYFADLRGLARATEEIEAIRLLRSKVNRNRMAEEVFELLVDRSSRDKPGLPFSKVDKTLLLQRYLARDSAEAVAAAVAAVKLDHVPENVEVDSASNNSSESSESVGNDGDVDVRLKGILTLLVTSSAFHTYIESLRRFLRRTTIDTFNLHLRSGNSSQVHRFLSAHYDEIVSSVDFTWVQELRDTGYSLEDLTELLVDEARNTPWIYIDEAQSSYKPGSAKFYLISHFHKSRCIHIDLPAAAMMRHKDGGTDGMSRSLLDRCLAETCGLAGVIPLGRNELGWIGSVSFKDKGTTASVTYGLQGEGIPSDTLLLSRTLQALAGFLIGLEHLQNHKLSCSGVTVLRCSKFSHVSKAIEAVYISASMAIELLSSLPEDFLWTPSLVLRCFHAAVTVLGTIVPDLQPMLTADHFYDASSELDLSRVLHIAALATQCLNLALLSYSQAHTGELKSPILMESLRHIVLLGSSSLETDSLAVCIRLFKLTCLDGMIGDQVLAFTANEGDIDSEERNAPDEPRYDLITSVEDFVDTWDESELLVDASTDSLEKIVAIKIAGGTIMRTEIGDRSHLVDSGAKPALTTFHWARGGPGSEKSENSFGKTSIMRIGAVTTNQTCPLSTGCPSTETTRWTEAQSRGIVKTLGTRNQFWEANERQVGLGVGQYGTVSFNQTSIRRVEKALKDVNLERSRISTPFLEAHWGLQISLCTGVARRVSLSKLLGDVVPAFLDAGIAVGHDWRSLVDDHRFIEALRDDEWREWTHDPAHGPKEQELAATIIRRVLYALRDTGIDRKGENLVVAWANKQDPYSCIKIPCKRTNLWTRILTDSVDCATFACYSHLCFESEDLKCRATEQPLWEQSCSMLDTAVCHYTPTPDPIFVLEYERPYWIGREDLYLLARAVRVGQNTQPMLYISVSRVPERMQKRVAKFSLVRFGLPKELKRIRERHMVGISAEPVCVLDAH